MDITKYDNDLTDVSDYLKKLGITIAVKHSTYYFKFFNIPNEKFNIYLYLFTKVGWKKQIFWI